MSAGDNSKIKRASGATKTEHASGAMKTERASDATASADATAKQLILEQVRAQPEDSSYDEILRELAFTRMVGRGLADADHGRTVDADEVRARAGLWQS